MSALPKGYAIGRTKHYSGIESNVKIFPLSKDFHLHELEKNAQEAEHDY